MPPRNQNIEQRQPSPPPQQPSPAPELKGESRPTAGKVSAARAAVRDFLATELDAREVRITKIAPKEHDGWSVEAEILVPNLEVKMLGLPLTQEVLEPERYSLELEDDFSVRSFNVVSEEE